MKWLYILLIATSIPHIILLLLQSKNIRINHFADPQLLSLIVFLLISISVGIAGLWHNQNRIIISLATTLTILNILMSLWIFLMAKGITNHYNNFNQVTQNTNTTSSDQHTLIKAAWKYMSSVPEIRHATTQEKLNPLDYNFPQDYIDTQPKEIKLVGSTAQLIWRVPNTKRFSDLIVELDSQQNGIGITIVPYR
jgi:hypothetical protein